MTTPKVCAFLSALAFSLFFMASPAMAACSGSSPTWTSTPDLSSMQSCVKNASNGDTINVSAGSAAWSSAITISGKGLNVIGAGVGNTVISGNAFFLDSIPAASKSNSPSVRISGFTFVLGGNVITLQDVKGFRIDHSALSQTSALNCVLSYGFATTNWGVLDHDTFTYCQQESLGGDYGNSLNGDNVAWSMPNPVGTQYAIYYEDDTFTNPDGSSAGYFNCFDAYQGGAYVVRFSALSGCRFEAHGVQGDNSRGTRSWEMYNDTLTNPAKPSYRPWLIRAGTGMIFHNSSDGTFLSNVINIDGPRLEEDSIASQVPKWQFCDGTNQSSYLITPGTTGGYTTFPSPKSLIVDAQGPGGYRCRDQIGASADSSTWASGWSSTPPSQGSAPAYIWKNTQPAGEMPLQLNCEAPGTTLCNNQATNTILQNRDYFTYNSSFDGTSGVGEGVAANRPSSCTKGVGYWTTDEGSWNANVSPNTSGRLYTCTSTNTWTLSYTPFPYPHPFTGNGTASGPTPPSGLQAILQ
jgi:hypothetical protein